LRIFTCCDTIYERDIVTDKRIDRHRTTSKKAALCVASRGKNAPASDIYKCVAVECSPAGLLAYLYVYFMKNNRNFYRASAQQQCAIMWLLALYDIEEFCPSVCPSVRLSHSGIVSKRPNVLSYISQILFCWCCLDRGPGSFDVEDAMTLSWSSAAVSK